MIGAPECDRWCHHDAEPVGALGRQVRDGLDLERVGPDGQVRAVLFECPHRDHHEIGRPLGHLGSCRQGE